LGVNEKLGEEMGHSR